MARDGKRNRTNKLFSIWERERANGLTELSFNEWLQEREQGSESEGENDCYD